MTQPSVPPLLQLKDISKRFPGVHALNRISFEIFSGEAHALLGENGAGKSTLLKILSGALQQDTGSIMLAGKALGRESPLDRQRLGISTVYQEFNLLPNLSVAENILVGREPSRYQFVDWKTMYRTAQDAARRLELTVDPRTVVAALSVAEQQLVEIAKALHLDAKVIILDEPTAALSSREVDRLHRIILDLKREGIGLIYVTHRLGEVPVICDRFTVLRDGKFAGGGNAATTPAHEIIRMMVGRDLQTKAQDYSPKTADIVLQVRNFARARKLPSSPAIMLRGISLEVRRGEILGLAGLVGAGRTELARAIIGADPIESGEIYLNGKRVEIKSPRDAIRAGIAMVPEDRKQQGLFLSQSIRQNLTLSSLDRLSRWKYFVDSSAEDEVIREFQKSLNIRMPNPETPIATLSGGNQQKVILARFLALSPIVLIVDEPTRGIDVGAKAEVHGLLRALAANGTAILVISSELPELISLCDRIYAIKEGKINGQMAANTVSEEKLMRLMTLGSHEAHIHAAIG
jgi:inositol transport system ATP-binding protein